MSQTIHKTDGNRATGNKLNMFLNREWNENVNWWVKRLTNKRRRRLLSSEVKIQLID